ncbi:hypothetical protein PAXRUDRAFT_29107, partial [Paxillus rubicundulus Ve08.2h10]
MTGKKWTNEEQRAFLMGKKSNPMKAQLQAMLYSFWSSTYLEFFEKWPEVNNAFLGKAYDSLTKDKQKELGEQVTTCKGAKEECQRHAKVAVADVEALHTGNIGAKQQIMAIEGLSGMSGDWLNTIFHLSGWHASVYMGGPGPHLDGQLQAYSFHHGQAQSGGNFHELLADHQEQIIKPFTTFLHTCYSSFPPPLSEEGTPLPSQPPSLTGDLTPSTSRLSTPGPSVTLPAPGATVPLMPASALGNLTPVGITQYPVSGDAFQMDINAFSGGQLSLDKYGLPPLPGGFEDRDSSLSTNILLNASAATGARTGGTAQDIFRQLAPNASYPTVNPSCQTPPAPATCSPSQPELPASILASESTDMIASSTLANLSAPAPVQVIISTIANAPIAFSSAAMTPAPGGPL